MSEHALSAEIASLVHHVELNKANWWDKGIQRFIIGAAWLSGTNMAAAQILTELRDRFSLNVEMISVRRNVRSLCDSGDLIELPGELYKLSEAAQKDIAETLRESGELASTAKSRFIGLFSSFCPPDGCDEAWIQFNEQLLVPLVREIGARTYQIVSGAGHGLDQTIRFPEFLQRYPSDIREKVRNAIIAFMDPKDTVTRAYVLGYLRTYFFVEAGNPRQETLEAIGRLAEKPPSFNIFIDTNFLFSILGLHANPSNEAADSLMQLLGKAAGKLKAKLYIAPITLDESRRVIGSHRDALLNLRLTPNVAEAASEMPLSGIAMRFVETAKKSGQSISPEDYFGPYVTNLLGILRRKGVELFNSDLNPYKTKQVVIDDILEQYQFEKRRFGQRAKSYEELEHDVVLWHFVEEKRPAQLETPLEAGCWIATVDYHFLGFDAYKNRFTSTVVPVCVHPTALIQMLQFWVPRTPEFEEAVLDSLRWPFLFQDFDPDAERVTIRILEVLARFEDVGDLPKELVARILLNDALRQRIASQRDIQKNVELVKEALSDENQRIRDDLKQAQEETVRLRKEVQQQTAIVEALTRRSQDQEAKFQDAEDKLKQAAAFQAQMKGRLDELESQRDKDAYNRNVEDTKRNALLSLVAGCLAVALGLTLAIFTRRYVPWLSASAVAVLAAGLLIFFIVYAGRVLSKSSLSGWIVTRTYFRVRKLLIGAVATVFLGVVANLVWEWIR